MLLRILYYLIPYKARAKVIINNIKFIAKGIETKLLKTYYKYSFKAN
jgi:hypothetical protein